jgi:FKBP-type peptidyl-prolyl cis-trans isomerase
MKLYVALVISVFFFFACKKVNENISPTFQADRDEEIIEYFLKDSIGYSRTNSGIYYKKANTTTANFPLTNDTVRVHYEGRVLYGKVFDSSYFRGETYEFVVGTTSQIEGWREAITLLRLGEKARFIIPSGLAYGVRGTTNIPSNSVLIFDIELITLRPVN